MSAVMSVSMTPGVTALQVMPLRAISRATVPREREHPGLGGAVVRLARVGAHGDDRGDVDDPPPARLEHVVERAARAVEGAVEVGVDDGLPVLGAHADREAVAALAGVVDEHEHRAVLFARSRRTRLRPASASPTSAWTSPPVRPSVTTVQPSARRRSAIAAPMPRAAAGDQRRTGVLRRRHGRAPSSDMTPAPQTKPAPNAAIATRGAGLAAALRSACHSASGIEARDVLATRSTFDDDLLLGHAEPARGGLDDAGVGLVGDEDVDVVDRRCPRGERLAGRLDHARDGVAVDLAALHPQHALVACRRTAGRRARRRSAARTSRSRGSRSPAADDDRAGAVAEEHRGAAVVVVGDAAQRLGAADDHELGAAGLDQRGGLVERVEEARARGVDVDRRRRGRSRSPGAPRARGPASSGRA